MLITLAAELPPELNRIKILIVVVLAILLGAAVLGRK